MAKDEASAGGSVMREAAKQRQCKMAAETVVSRKSIRALPPRTARVVHMLQSGGIFSIPGPLWLARKSNGPHGGRPHRHA
jgi:hypothetical protein